MVCLDIPLPKQGGGGLEEVIKGEAGEKAADWKPSAAPCLVSPPPPPPPTTTTFNLAAPFSTKEVAVEKGAGRLWDWGREEEKQQQQQGCVSGPLLSPKRSPRVVGTKEEELRRSRRKRETKGEIVWAATHGMSVSYVCLSSHLPLSHKKISASALLQRGLLQHAQ
jgi:hypothetical protein